MVDDGWCFGFSTSLSLNRKRIFCSGQSMQSQTLVDTRVLRWTTFQQAPPFLSLWKVIWNMRKLNQFFFVELPHHAEKGNHLLWISDPFDSFWVSESRRRFLPFPKCKFWRSIHKDIVVLTQAGETVEASTCCAPMRAIHPKLLAYRKIQLQLQYVQLTSDVQKD
jgi:hypothetical protein